MLDVTKSIRCLVLFDIKFTGLLDLPVNTLGHTYSSFMKRNKITPDSRTEVLFVFYFVKSKILGILLFGFVSKAIF